MRYTALGAISIHTRMQALGIEATIGVTSMFGQDGMASERFYLPDAELLTS